MWPYKIYLGEFLLEDFVQGGIFVLELFLITILSGEPMATRVLSLINGRLKFLYSKQRFLSFSLRGLFCNALIQPHSSYACFAWYPYLNKRFAKKIQISQNKCIRFCLKLENRTHIGIEEFRKLSWLPTKARFEQCLCVNIFNFFNNVSRTYVSEVYQPFNHGHNTRRAAYKLQLPYRNSIHRQEAVSYLGPRLWNNLPVDIKSNTNVNTFKHDIKKLFFDEPEKRGRYLHIPQKCFFP